MKDWLPMLKKTSIAWTLTRYSTSSKGNYFVAMSLFQLSAWNSNLVTIPRPGRRVEVLSSHFLQPSAWQKDTGWMRSFSNWCSNIAKQEQQQGKQVKNIYEKTYQLKFKFHSIVFKCFQCIYETFVKGQLLNVINISIYFKFSRQVYKTIKIFDADYLIFATHTPTAWV